MASTNGLSLICCLLLTLSPAALGKVINTVPTQRGLEFGPFNTVVNAGSSVQLRCITDGVVGSNIRWYESVTRPDNPTLISDGPDLILSHPNSARYSLDTPDDRTINLNIANVNFLDAGYYECQDSTAAPPSQISWGADLVVVEKAPTCNTTYPFDTGAVLEGQYHTAQCIQSFNATRGIRPLQTWTGPPPFNYGYSYDDNTVWSGISFTVDRSMNAQNWICLTNFTHDLFQGPNRDNFAPSYTVFSPTNQIFVFWGPTNMTAYPIQAAYEIGQSVYCYADAWPQPTFTWTSLRNSENWYEVSFTIREDMVGYQLMRCEARNVIYSVPYTRDFFQDVYVNPITTPTTTSAPVTTTEAPDWGDCGLLTGFWTSTNPDAQLCIVVNTVDGTSRITGFYKNATERTWMGISGITRVNNYKTLAWTMIFPGGSIGVLSFAAECHSCKGTEQIMANGISRTTTDSEFCGSGGTVKPTSEYTFFRAPPVYPCTVGTTEQQRLYEQFLQGKQI